MADEEEIWKVYPEFPFIEANQFGEIRIKDRIVTDKNGKKRHIKSRVLKQSDNGTGYLQVGFGMNCKKFYLYVHRIMATCFIQNPYGYPEVNHIDNDRMNNFASNLEWCSSKQNIAHREKCGVSAKESTKVLREPVIVVDLNSFKVFLFESRMEASRQLGANQSAISAVIKGKRTKTGDCWFCDADENAVEKTRDKFSDDVAREVEKLMNENCNF